MANAKLVYQNKLIYSDGSIMQIVIWKLPKRTSERPHGLKYRLYYGDSDGNCIIRYDNEVGKGDHKHHYDQQQDYEFVTAKKLIEDFLKDINEARSELL
jgi:hypothetical protein